MRIFGATVGRNVRVYNSTRVYYPPNLDLGDNVVVGPDVDLYCVAEIVLKPNSMVSQYAYLCAASHDYRLPDLPLIAKPIVIEERAWVCARAFIGPDVTVGEDVVVGACSAVFKTVPAGQIVGGNPARFIKMRFADTDNNPKLASNE